MFDQISGNPMSHSCWYIKWTVTKANLVLFKQIITSYHLVWPQRLVKNGQVSHSRPMKCKMRYLLETERKETFLLFYGSDLQRRCFPLEHEWKSLNPWTLLVVILWWQRRKPWDTIDTVWKAEKEVKINWTIVEIFEPGIKVCLKTTMYLDFLFIWTSKFPLSCKLFGVRFCYLQPKDF